MSNAQTYNHPLTPYPTFSPTFASSSSYTSAPLPFLPYLVSSAIPSPIYPPTAYASASGFPTIHSPPAPLRRAPMPPHRHVPRRARSNHMAMVEPERKGLWTVTEEESEVDTRAGEDRNMRDEPEDRGRVAERRANMGWGTAPDGFGLGLGIDMSSCGFASSSGAGAGVGLFSYLDVGNMPRTPISQMSSTQRTRSWLGGKLSMSPSRRSQSSDGRNDDVFMTRSSPTSSEESFGERASPLTTNTFLQTIQAAAASSKRPPPLDLSHIPYSIDRPHLPALGTPFSSKPSAKQARTPLLPAAPILSSRHMATHRQIPRTPGLISCSDAGSSGSTRSSSSCSSASSAYATEVEASHPRIQGNLMSAFEDLLESCEEDRESLAPFIVGGKAGKKGPEEGFGSFPLPPFRLAESASVPSLDLPVTSQRSSPAKRSSRAPPPPPLVGITQPSPRPALVPSPTRSSFFNAPATTPTMPITPLKSRHPRKDPPAPALKAPPPSKTIRTIPPSSSRALQDIMGMGTDQGSRYPREAEPRRRGSGDKRLPERGNLPQAWLAI